MNIDILPIPRTHDVATLPSIGLRYPGLANARLAFHRAEFTHCTGRTQAFPLSWYRTGYGYRPLFVCSCQRRVIRLYLRFGSLSCRRCANIVYASQACSPQKRPALQATRIRRFFDALSYIGKPFPSKPKTTMRFKTYHRLKARALALEAKSQAKTAFQSNRLDPRVLYPQCNYGRQIAFER